jgi:hypothetical protein
MDTTLNEDQPSLQQQQDDWMYWDWYTQQRAHDEAFEADAE